MEFFQNKSFWNRVRSRDWAVLLGENIPLWNMSRKPSQACTESYFPCRKIPGGARQSGTPFPLLFLPASLLPGAPESLSSLREFLIDQSLSGNLLCNCTVA